MIYVTIFFSACLFFYGSYLLVNAVYFTRSFKIKDQQNLKFPAVSVLIAVRNEADKIETCLQAVLAQEYPSNLLEVIVIDDSSEDATLEKVKALQKHHPQLKLIQRTGEIQNAFKKAAISQGIAVSTGEIILTTDADCAMRENWVKTMVSFFSTEVGMVSGPVVLESSNRMLEEFQVLEFMGLIAVGAASIRAGRPNMCNGANLAYRKSVFEAVNGFGGLDSIASGDDELLMHKIHGAGYGIRFAKDPMAIVRTHALKTWSDFRNQRLRWVSKSTVYKRKSITLTLVASYLGMVTFPLLGVFACFESGYLIGLGGAFLFKCLCEFPILFSAARFFNKLHLLKWLLLEQFFHILYILWVGLAANLGGYTWKGRNVS